MASLPSIYRQLRSSCEWRREWNSWVKKWGEWRVSWRNVERVKWLSEGKEKG